MPSVIGLAADLTTMQLTTREFNLRFQYALTNQLDVWKDSEERQYQRDEEIREQNE